MKLNKQEICEIAELAGLNLDSQRATTIASRLSGILEQLNEIPQGELIAVEPSQTFLVDRKIRDD